MAVNFYFQNGIPGGRRSEQLLHEDIIIECLKIYGFETYYLPRTEVSRDLVLNEDLLSKFTDAYPIEMYLESVNGFEGEGQLLTKFGLEFRDTATFIVARRRWEELVGRTGTSPLSTRPAEGDIIFFPLTKSFFEIRKVEVKDPFFQLGKLYTFRMECELMQFSHETFDTKIQDIDNIPAEINLDINEYNLTLESGGRLLLNTESDSALVLASYDIENIDDIAQNDIFREEAISRDVLDFTDRNPFGDIL